MSSNKNGFISPGARLEFAVLIAFAIVSFLTSIPVGVMEILIIIYMAFYYCRVEMSSRRELVQRAEQMTVEAGNAAVNPIRDFPFPLCVVEVSSGTIIWGNVRFSEILGSSVEISGENIFNIISSFSLNWVNKGINQANEEIEIANKKFSVFGNMVSPLSDDENENAKRRLAVLYFIDTTDFATLKELYEKTRPVVAICLIDNYEELIKSCSESEKSDILARIDKAVTMWSQPSNGMLRKYDRDKYLFIFEERYLPGYISERFKILDAVEEIESINGIKATLSIGIGYETDGFAEKYAAASLAIDMALSRGGDQAVIKGKNNFEFFGGHAQNIEKRTKVRSRVLANAVNQLIADSSCVFVMGHKMSDLDSVGAAAGIVCMARALDKKAYIVIDRTKSVAGSLLNRLAELPEYEEVFINGDTAMLYCDAKSLTVVVDTNRPEAVEYPPLLESVRKIAVIDHHRRAASYIEGSAVSMHEPYASSASELVAELMQYSVTGKDVLKQEAEAILAGIYLDTRGFSSKTGARTFEAAAYLKRLGADMVEVKKLFQSDFDEYIEKNSIVEKAKVYHEHIAVAKTDCEVSRACAGQAADDLLDITDINASVVIFRCNDKTFLSARSLGEINVQVLMEKVGGGGSHVNAGAQLDKSPDEAEKLLLKAIEQYYSENHLNKE